jgi:hypothetical protein
MSETPNLALPFLAAGQAQKHVTLNEIAEILDAAAHLSVLSRSLTTPPVSTSPGARYLLPPGATGVWQGQIGKIASWTGFGWRYLEPRAGWLLWDQAADIHVVFDGADWIELNNSSSIQNATLVGVNTTADSTNRLAVKSDGVLFSHEDGSGHGDLRAVMNKMATSNTVSQLYQTGFSGRAEIGLAGDDDLRIKVSSDGLVWRDAMQIAHATGIVSFPQGVAGLSGGSAGAFGQCGLGLVGGNLRLRPVNGNLLTVNGTAASVPGAGVTLAATGLTPGTNYYIYAVASAGAVSSLEASATAYTTHTDGTAIKTGDATRALVGMARCVTGPAWADSEIQRFVRSWFNRDHVLFIGPGIASTRTTTSTSLVEINSETRAEFLTWANEAVLLNTHGSAFNSSNFYVAYAVGVDGTSTRTPINAMYGTSGGATTGNGVLRLAEGYHYATLIGSVTGGTGSFYLGNSGGPGPCRISGAILS